MIDFPPQKVTEDCSLLKVYGKEFSQRPEDFWKSRRQSRTSLNGAYLYTIVSHYLVERAEGKRQRAEGKRQLLNREVLKSTVRSLTTRERECVYRALLSVCRALLSEYRALLSVYNERDNSSSRTTRERECI